MKRLLALVCLVCCYCSYSWADGYSATYSVGDAGPNGGTVTSVIIDSNLGDTTTELIGGFQETTETWNHTETVTEIVTTQIETTEIIETVTEVVESVVTTVQTPVESTVTTEVKTPTTTDSLAPDLNSTNYSKSDKVIIGPSGGCSYSNSVAAKEACFGSATGRGYDGGGTITSNKFDIDTDMSQKELQEGFDIDYGLRVESHSSNTQVPFCENTTGDCKDKFTMTVNLYKNDNSLINSYSHSVILDYNGQRNFSWDQTIGANNYGLGVQAEFVIWGVDAGYGQGYYGPIVYDPWLTVTYDVISYVTETITTYVTEQVVDYVTTYVTNYETITNIEEVQTTYTSEFTDTTTVFTSDYIGDPIADIPVEDTAPILEDNNFTVEIEDIEGNIVASFEIDVVEVSPGTVEVTMTSTDIDTGIAEIETVTTIEAFSEIETFDSSTGSDMGASVDSVDSLSDLAEISNVTTTTTTAEPEIDVEVTGEITVEVSDVDVAETSVDSNIEVNTSIDEGSSNAEAGENTGNVESSGGETDSVQSESVSEAGSNESTDESGDSGSEGQESEDIQEGSESTESEETQDDAVQESSGDVEESVGDSESDNNQGEGSEDGDNNEESSEESGSKSGKSTVNKNPKQVKKATKAAITKKILQQIQQRATEDFAAGENLRLILLSIQGDTEAFKEYQTKIVQKQNDWYVDEGIYNDVKQLEDPYSVLYSLAQDKKHNEMVEEQYRD